MLGCSTVLTPRYVVNFVVLLADDKTMFHLLARVSGETPFLLVDVMELMLTLFIKDEVKSSIIVGGLLEYWILGGLGEVVS